MRKSHRFVLRKKLNENKPKRHKMGKIIKMQFCPCGTKDLFIISQKRGRFRKERLHHPRGGP